MKPNCEPFEQSEMLPFLSTRITQSDNAQEPLLSVNLDQQHQSLLHYGLFTVNSMIFYDCSRDATENDVNFHLAKVISVNRETRQLEVEKFVEFKSRTQKGMARKCHTSTKSQAELISFDRTIGIQFDLNVAHHDIPLNVLKKLEQYVEMN